MSYTEHRSYRSPGWMGVYIVGIVLWLPTLLFARTVAGRVVAGLFLLLAIASTINEASKPSKWSAR